MTESKYVPTGTSKLQTIELMSEWCHRKSYNLHLEISARSHSPSVLTAGIQYDFSTTERSCIYETVAFSNRLSMTSSPNILEHTSVHTMRPWISMANVPSALMPHFSNQAVS